MCRSVDFISTRLNFSINDQYFALSLILHYTVSKMGSAILTRTRTDRPEHLHCYQDKLWGCCCGTIAKGKLVSFPVIGLLRTPLEVTHGCLRRLTEPPGQSPTSWSLSSHPLSCPQSTLPHPGFALTKGQLTHWPKDNWLCASLRMHRPAEGGQRTSMCGPIHPCCGTDLPYGTFAVLLGQRKGLAPTKGHYHIALSVFYLIKFNLHNPLTHMPLSADCGRKFFYNIFSLTSALLPPFARTCK